MVTLEPLIIRADAGLHIGSGHLMRCLALAQGWKDGGGEVVFATACSNDNLLGRLYEEGFRVHKIENPYPHPQDWQTTRQILEEHKGAWLVIDGYHFDSSYQRLVKESGHPLLAIDDYGHAGHYYADIVLNQNLHAESLPYSCEPYTKLLLGTKYVLLRREFLKWRGWKREVPEVARKLLVTMGGSDPKNVTLKVINAINMVDFEPLEVAVVVGPTNPHYEALERAARTSRHSIILMRDVPNMAELMSWADIAIAAGGTTCWELVFSGLPFIVIALAKNQRLVAEAFNDAGCALNLGWYYNLSSSEIAEPLLSLLLNQKRRAEMNQCGQQIVDGKGAIRVLCYMGLKALRLRPACEEDCQLLWEWANDAQVRESAFCSVLIPWEEHVKWFNDKLSDPNCLVFIAEDQKGIPIGQIRFDIEGEQAEVDVSIDKGKRGLGYGAYIIENGVKELFQNTMVKTVHAFIKPDNISSTKSFEKAGFRYIGIDTAKGHKAKHYVMER
ncbi:UDP-2,4-diacetamido-2,4,6-trideoxy-beta-L-altropyranose hydrolase [Acetomicrobium sp. S15 = DSM 107314]|uniref:UDP-2,4-diacetamido-2,4, 6-trideoxy-beta-L-altropyranose hydrolase n=1 Tax=Acetomicrobium sp. S15 = DSM 107314 TaxID=2529858 RepID=UPI00315982A5